ncbi:hypothetical protein LCGC14_2719770 [marine sediment metagenome]|uniref:Uncharacterized protein n=1 Tax=marine sediment metagenome TaxID=412755 RepID=A0A0F9C251_9ZZZZ
MRKYTERVHAQRTLKMFLNRKEPYAHCPAQKGYGKAHTRGVPEEMWDMEGAHPCEVCGDFVGSPDECPCVEFGAKEAIERTWRALREKGYLSRRRK